MNPKQNTSIIYGDAPFIEDMGVLTTLCLLHDEVFLFGSKSLGEHFEDYWASKKRETEDDFPSVVEQTFQILHPEGVVSFFSPSDVPIRFPGTDEIELDGIEGIETIDEEGKKCVVIKTNLKELNNFSRIILRGFKKGNRTLSDMIRDLSIFTAAISSKTPIVCEAAHVALTPSDSHVSETSTFLAHRALQRLALPELRAYHAEDILEARLKLKDELFEFKAAILELVWLLYRHTESPRNLSTLSKECDILIDTKIASAMLLLQKAISEHKNKKIRRILRATGGAVLEIGKSLLAPSFSSILMGGSGALMKFSDGLKTQPPNIQVASFIYKIREKKFK